MKLKEDDIRVNAGKVEICTKIVYTKDGVEQHWEDYDTRLLASTLGQCGHSDEFYPLLRYKEAFDMTKADKEYLALQSNIENLLNDFVFQSGVNIDRLSLGKGENRKIIVDVVLEEEDI